MFINFTYMLWWCVLCIQLKRVIPITSFHSFFGNDFMVFEVDDSASSSDIESLLLGAGNISKIYVYVVNTFYVDEDLNLNGITELEIFAKIWNITQPVTFDLSGPSGERQATAVNGSAGNSGNAGTDGGNFFGLAIEVINGDYLTIKSNGGNGGDGQDGATNDDIYVLFNVDDVVGNSGWFSSGDLYSYYKKYFDDRGYDSDVSGIDDSTSFYAVFVHDKKASFNVRLHPTTCCGTTGSGGAGGHGGRSGKLKFRHVGKSYTNNGSESTLKMIANNGTAGKSGKDGTVCDSFALDVRIDTELNKVVFVFLPLHHTFSSNFTVLNHSKSYKCPPVYVRSNESIVLSETQEIDIPSSVIRYKQFLLKCMNDFALTAFAQQTYKEIDENKEIHKEFSVRNFVLEALELERNYFPLRKAVKMMSLYRRLFDRVEWIKLSKRNGSDEQALSQLQSILELKLSDIREADNYHLILNLEAFAGVVVWKIDYRNEKISDFSNCDDMELQKMLNELRFAVNGNYILSEYYHVIEGFRLTYFPFAVNYLEEHSIPTSVLAYDDLDTIASTANKKLKTLPRIIEEINSENAKVTMNLNYINYGRPTFAVYIWKNSDVRKEIRDLFEGKKTTLIANVKKPNKEYNAIKFNTVDFVFRASNPTINDQLNDVLNSFQLEFNHTGISVMRCNNDFYQIKSEPIELLMSFHKRQDQIPTTRSLTYDMLRHNRQILSPFSFWELQMVDENRNRRNVINLERFKQFDIDIELHVTGKYIAEDASICANENLSKFYTQV